MKLGERLIEKLFHKWKPTIVPGRFVGKGIEILTRPAGCFSGDKTLARFSHHLPVEARNRPAITALRLLAVLNGLFKYARIIQEMRRRAARALY